MKTHQIIPVATLLMFLANIGPAATLYVNLNSTNPVPPYADWNTAATNIQDAVDASTSGDLILVTNGVYQTGGQVVYGSMANRVALTMPVTVQSVNGPGVTVIQGFPVIGDSAVRCAYLASGATLSGFTLTNGATRASGDYIRETYGAGVWCESTNSTISNCVIIANHAQYYGGGTYSGTFNNCTLAQNNAGDGGGGALGATLNNCVLSTNSATSFAGGAYYSTLNNCILAGNDAYYGGGAEGCTLSNCVLSGNSASAGGAADGCTLLNCSISGNSASTGGGVESSGLTNCALTANVASTGGGADNSSLANCTLTGNSAGTGGGASGGTLNNCIVYFNNAPTGSNYSAATLNYCCTSPLPDSGTNNITLDPKLADSTHLAAESPCRGAGSSLFVTGVDIDGEPWANPPSIGCDEYYPGSATGLMSVTFQVSYTNIPAGFVVSFVAQISGHATASRWEFGDGTVISNEPYCSHFWTASGNYPVLLRAYNDDYPAGLTATTIVSVLDHPVQYVALTSTNPIAPYLAWATAASNIQDAVDVGYINGTILVSNGVYSTGGRLMTGSATNRLVVTQAITVQSVNGPTATTIQGYQVPGTTNANGAIRCVYLSGGASLVGFTLTDGGAPGGPGGGVWCSSAGSIVSNCILIGNSAYTAGGGAWSGTLNNCLIISNSVTGPGYYPGAGPGGPYGGGTYNSTLNDCMLAGNLGFLGGGAAGGTLNSCIIVNNSASQGGGTYGGVLNNCTVVNNSATNAGGGVYNGTLNNSIVYFNTSTNGPNYYQVQLGGGLNLNYCCTTPMPVNGVGNITNTPTFVNSAAGDFHLQSNSPCVNSGNNAYVTSAADLDGNPRIVGGTVDIGAYEYQTPASVISYAWLQQYDLPTDGSVDYADLDGTGFNVYQDWIAGLNPTNALSVLAMLPPAPTNNPAGLVVSWESVSGITYFLQSSTNLGMQPAFSTIQSNLVGQAGTTSYTDTNAVGNGPFFYRVGVQQ